MAPFEASILHFIYIEQRSRGGWSAARAHYAIEWKGSVMRGIILTIIAVVSLVFLGPITASAEDEAGEYVISLYQAATGKQLELLKWMAEQDEIRAEAGLPPAQIFAHIDGDSWDYLVISPVGTDEQDAAFAEAAKKRGWKVGFAGGLKFRTMIHTHTDTVAWGPTTAAELVAAADE